MISCQRCQASYEDDELRYCGRCGSDMRRSVSRENPLVAAAEAAPATPLAGRVIDGRYRVLDQVGTGGMGSVFRVEHVAMGKIAALKMLHPTLSTDREIVKRFRREAEAVSMLTHPNTVQVFDFGESDGCLYMVMELCRGEDLAAILRRDGPMPWPRASSLLLQICDALAEAHEAGIIHRDLKPENVIITRGRDGREVAKVLDFGLAKLREREDLGAVTARGSLIGTPFYMSPEQIRSEEPDGRSDIYSLGAMMYRMLTGQHPFSAPTPVGVLTQHLTDELVPPHVRAPDLHFDPRVEAIIARCMAKKREERFTTAPDLRCAIDEARGPDKSPPPASLREPSREIVTERRGALLESSTSSPAAARMSREDFDRFERALKVKRWLSLSLVPLLLLGGAAAGWWAWRRDVAPTPVEVEVEPNDTPTMANLIASGKTVRGHIGKRVSVEESDRDFFHFHVDQGPQLLRVELKPIPNMDLRLSLHDGHGARLAEADAGGPGDGELLPNQRLDGGDYYLEVREVWIAGRQATENITDEYALTATWRAPAPDEEMEPDDTPASALALPLDRPMNGFLSRANDVDFFYPEGVSPGAIDGSITAIEGVDVRLIVLPPGAVVAEDPAHLDKTPGARVFDSGGPGKPEHFADVAWPPSGSPPLIAVQRQDHPPDASGRRPPLAGVDARYSLLVARARGAGAPH